MDQPKAVAHNTASIKRVRSDQYREVYANLCQGRIGTFDLTLSFYLTKEPPEYDGLVNEEQVSVTLAPSQFKMLSELCAGLTAAYEATFAPIAIPQGAQNNSLSAAHIIGLIKAAQAVQASAVSPASDSSTAQRPLGKRLQRAAKRKAT